MRLSISLLLSLFVVAAHAQTASIYGTGAMQGTGVMGEHLIDKTPPMGYNTWYGISCVGNCGTVVPITESAVKAQADNLANASLTNLCANEYPPAGSGCVSLAGLGYTLVSIDDTWDDRSGGIIEGIPAQFPSGMASLGTYIHGKGLRFGLYGSPGTTTCGSYPAQYTHETSDANTIASWGVDYWKHDWCTDAAAIWGSTSAGGENAYQTMGTALEQTGRRISYLVNAAYSFTPSWFAQVGATTVRIGADNGHDQTWYSKFIGSLSYATPYQNKGHWLDFDMMLGGLNEAPGGTTPMSDTEARAQFNAYAIAAAPLIIGNKIDALDASLLTTYANSEVIAVDQDSLGVMGTLRDTTTCGATVCHVWTRLLANGDYAICLINYDPSNAHTVAVLWSDFGQSGTFNIRDLWTHSSVGSSSSGYSVSLPAWGSTMLRISR